MTGSADELRILAPLSLDEKVRLLTGADNWTTGGCAAIGLRPMVLSDGPVGVRGTRVKLSDPSSSLPCPAAFAATWDEQLVGAPFEACVAEAGVAMVMAAYNSVNGAAMTANRRLLTDLLKNEWAFAGVVVSDWNATRATVASALAGLDLVMPGPGGPWGERLVAAVKAGEVPEALIDDKLARLLGLARRVGALTGRTPAPAGGDPRRLVDPALLRRAAAGSFVLLRNRARRGRPLLPLDGAALRRVAVIGPNAVRPQTQGGGSVQVLAVAGPTPAQALEAALGDKVQVAEGCRTWTTVPAPGAVRDPLTGEAGVRVEVRAPDGAVLHDGIHPSSAITWWHRLPRAVHVAGGDMVMRARYMATTSGPHLIGAAGIGTVRIQAGGRTLAEAVTLPPGELVAAMARPPELRVPVDLHEGREVDIRVEHQPAEPGGRLPVTIPQAYLASPDGGPGRPVCTLAAFAPVDAAPGGMARVRLRVPARAFARYDEAAGRWAWPRGRYTLCVGRSSRDLRLSVPVTVGGAE